MLHKSVIAIVFAALLIGVYGGCSDNNNDRTTAVLNAMESIAVPSRIEMDGSESFAKSGGELVSHTYTVFDMETGEIVFGPEAVTELLDQAFIRTYILPEDAPENEVGVITVSGDFLVTLDVEDDTGETDTATRVISLDAQVLPGSSDTCSATCSGSSNDPGRVVCTLIDTNCFNIDIVDNVLDPAATVDSVIGEDTTMWIWACGGNGGPGSGTSPERGGRSGPGGFAQTITTVSGYQSTFGGTAIVYYIGRVGIHADSGGSGGASTIVSNKVPSSGDPLALENLVILAGGGGGGGLGNGVVGEGGNGGAGGFAYSDTVGQSATGVGFTSGSRGGQGGGGTDCDENIACGGVTGKGGDKVGAKDGEQGIGGKSGGSVDNTTPPEGGAAPRKWINASNDINAGKGGNGGGVTGGGGGGFGGGGAGGNQNPSIPSKYFGGGGGGSYASASTTTDTNAPDTNICGSNGNGEVVITFNVNTFQ